MPDLSRAENDLLKQFPYDIHPISGGDGELVWIQRGVNPDNIFDDKRRSDWPYSIIIADLICQKIVEGESLTKICKNQGYPPYSVVCRWRAEHPEFKEQLELAYKDRAELFIEKIIDLVDEIDQGENRRKLRLKLQALKWCAQSRVLNRGALAESMHSITIKQ